MTGSIAARRLNSRLIWGVTRGRPRQRHLCGGQRRGCGDRERERGDRYGSGEGLVMVIDLSEISYWD
jgi:hypothetical protein